MVSYKDALALAAIKSVFSFAVSNGLLDSNPATGVRIARRANGERPPRLPYSLDEARARLDASGKLADSRHWLVWLLAYSGCRLAEAAGLRTQDVQQIEGTWCAVIEDTEVRRVKTRSSRRVVPLSPVLIAAGFLEHVEATRATGRCFQMSRPIATAWLVQRGENGMADGRGRSWWIGEKWRTPGDISPRIACATLPCPKMFVMRSSDIAAAAWDDATARDIRLRCCSAVKRIKY